MNNNICKLIHGVIDTGRNSKITKQNERSKLISDKAKEYLKIAELN